MSHALAPDAAVIIPARNEEARIGACLTALANQKGRRFRTILVINNTTARTGAIARETAARLGLDLTVLECSLAPHEGVGTARRIGCDHALRALPDLRYLLTTDADCIVGPHWLTRNIAHLNEVEAVCGKIDPIAAEAHVLSGMDPQLTALEGRYRTLVQEFYARHAPGCTDLAGTHGEAAGASLAFSAKAYLGVGGFAPISCGEDRRIIRIMREKGCTVRHVDDVTVQASCRLRGRATGGMSDALKARIDGVNYLIDDCLPPADWLIRHAVNGKLGPWPMQVSARLRLWVRDLPRHIETLEICRNSGWAIPAPKAPAVTLPRFQPGSEAPEWGSALVPANPRTRREIMSDGPMANQIQPVGTADPERSLK